MNKKGNVLLITLFLISGALGITLIASNIIIAKIKMTGVQIRSTKAYYAAEAGIEHVLWDIRQNGSNLIAQNADENIYGTTTLSNNASYVVKYSTSSSQYIFTSFGYYEDTKREVEVRF